MLWFAMTVLLLPIFGDGPSLITLAFQSAGVGGPVGFPFLRLERVCFRCVAQSAVFCVRIHRGGLWIGNWLLGAGEGADAPQGQFWSKWHLARTKSEQVARPNLRWASLAIGQRIRESMICIHPIRESQLASHPVGLGFDYDLAVRARWPWIGAH